ncbi:hypothetical protein, conserved [Trypanosoma brucei gambiense DAL972]|uniref:AB hydrolase-1 domain-containing protein n=2 Tax=Trypanosoma brucei TaxID=5691 RepID=C9ZW49_TRYB9|nr:hypothetical protein, conserved [Trypanosoma brucei gambiense DAL972]RHW72995.1 Ankyrin repeats (many copies)/Alpha/beta hydrolase family [Trypanosoma brucei equiperdum]CBH13638.1 hypothetical protein, conserved [Trypanosoma brucei gambiense DAL972]|eukprot:XP_011775914.1 hypothetical protein, conserved [Trypanosoma brucei gambiense DAL972]
MNTPLHAAATVGDIRALVRISRVSSTNVNAVDEEGRTPLHIAAEKGNMEFVRMLFRKFNGVDTTILDNSSKTAVQRAPVEQQQQLTLLLSVEEANTIARAKDNLNVKREKEEEENVYKDHDVEGSDMVNPQVLRKIVICLLVPFVYPLLNMGTIFVLQYAALTFVFYFVVVGYFLSEFTIKPPWYHHHPKSNELTARGCPDYWNGCVNDPFKDLGLQFDNVSFSSTDQYVLRGWHVPPPSDKPRGMGVVLVHGGGRDRRAWLRHVPFLHNAGYGCLLFDFREHGLSDGNMRGFTYGMKERFDVVAACHFMRSECGYNRICAMGTSVGASSAIMAAAIDKTIDIIVAENAILTCAALQDQQIVNIIGGYFARRVYSTFFFNLLRRTASFWLNYRIGNKPSKHCQALHCIAKVSPRPILLMHGTADELVPCRHSQKLFEEASEPKELYLAEGAFHCGLHNTHKEEYEARVLGFLQRYGGG